MTTFAVLFTVALLATDVAPPFAEGECFRVTAVPDERGAPPYPGLVAQNGFYLAERVFYRPDGTWPPNGGEGCETTSSTLAVIHGDGSEIWVTCTTPEPLAPQAAGFAKIELGACPWVIFDYDFDTGNLNGWSFFRPAPDSIFSDGFDSGDFESWSGFVAASFPG